MGFGFQWTRSFWSRSRKLLDVGAGAWNSSSSSTALQPGQVLKSLHKSETQVHFSNHSCCFASCEYKTGMIHAVSRKNIATSYPPHDGLHRSTKQMKHSGQCRPRHRQTTSLNATKAFLVVKYFSYWQRPTTSNVLVETSELAYKDPKISEVVLKKPEGFRGRFKKEARISEVALY